MIEQGVKYSKSFNWRLFFRIVGSVFFIGFGGSISAYTKGNLFLMAIGFIMAGIGVALLFMDSE